MSDLNDKEQYRVRLALNFLHVRAGTWQVLGKALGSRHVTLARIARGSRAVSAGLAVRVARFVGVGVDDLLAGRFPEAGTCPMCGHREEESAALSIVSGAAKLKAN